MYKREQGYAKDYKSQHVFLLDLGFLISKKQNLEQMGQNTGIWNLKTDYSFKPWTDVPEYRNMKLENGFFFQGLLISKKQNLERMGQNSCLALVQGVLGGSLSSNLELDADDNDQSILIK